MGLIRAAAGAMGGSLADQWKDFYTVPTVLPQTAALFPAIQRGTNAGRGSDTKASEAIITNGSRIMVPEGYGLMTFEGGEITGLATEPGPYIWDSDDLDSESVFVEGGIVSPFIKQSWQRFKFGGRPGAQQLALFVSLKELPNNKFGTQSAIYWDDDYLQAQVGATTRGTYTLKIVDPIVFVKNLVPASYLQNGLPFDFTDQGNEVAMQLFSEVVGSLAGAFSAYTNDPDMEHRITNIQRDSIGFSASLRQVVEDAFRWSTDRGLSIEKVAILGIEYDEPTRELLTTVQRADALSGSRGNSNLQASIAAGLETAGSVDGAAGILGLGVASGNLGIANLQQPPGSPAPGAGAAPAGPTPGAPAVPADDLVARLEQLRAALDGGLISQDEYDTARQRALGI